MCNDAVAIFFMFDLSRKSTLNSIKEWYRQVSGAERGIWTDWVAAPLPRSNDDNGRGNGNGSGNCSGNGSGNGSGSNSSKR